MKGFTLGLALKQRQHATRNLVHNMVFLEFWVKLATKPSRVFEEDWQIQATKLCAKIFRNKKTYRQLHSTHVQFSACKNTIK